VVAVLTIMAETAVQAAAVPTIIKHQDQAMKVLILQ
jgi:hypothetical protein